MGDDLKNKKPTKRTTTSKSSSSSPMSAEDKLKKRMKGLSHIGGGTGGLNLNSSTDLRKSTDNSKSRKKVGGVVLDEATIQDANKQKFETRGRRNSVIILVLGLALIVSIVYLIVAIVGYVNSKKDPNCKYTVVGNAQAQWVVEGGSTTKFVLKDGLSSGYVYLVDSAINIQTVENVSLTVEVKVLLEGEEILIYNLQDPNENLERVSEDANMFRYKEDIIGGGTIMLFRGLDFTEAPTNLNSDNVQIEIIAYVNIV